MKIEQGWIRRGVAALSVAVAMLLATGGAFADKLHLKDGRVLDGKIVRQGDGFVFFKYKVGSVETEQLFTMDAVSKIEKTDAAPAAAEGDAAKPEGEKAPAKGEADETSISSSKEVVKKPGVTRVAVLNFGPPRSWEGNVDSMVGGVIQAKFWDQAIPLLEKDKVDVVIVRVNSGGGALLEIERFHKVYQEKYKKKFRLAGWIESAISAAAMSPWVIEDFYFMKDGSMGACTGFSGRLNAIKGFELEQVLYMMEGASELGRHNKYIMRAMQIQEPLSVDFDEVGNPVWRQDEAGQLVLNRANRVFTFTANNALESKFSKGTANDLPELMKVMGIQEWELAGQAATDLIDKSMREADTAEKSFVNTYQKYALAVQYAQQAQDQKKRGEFVGQARRHLAELKRKYKDNWLAAASNGIGDEEWFVQQERMLRELVGP